MSETSFAPGAVLHDVIGHQHWIIRGGVSLADDVYAVTMEGDPQQRVFRARAWPDGHVHAQGRLIHPREAEPGMRILTRAPSTHGGGMLLGSALIHRVSPHDDGLGVSISHGTGVASYRDADQPRIEVTLPEDHPAAIAFPGPGVHRSPRAATVDAAA